jgi:hypothetical protein
MSPEQVEKARQLAEQWQPDEAPANRPDEEDWEQLSRTPSP